MQLNWLWQFWRGPQRFAIRVITLIGSVLILLIFINYGPRIVLWMPGMQDFESAHFAVWAQNNDRREAIWLRTMLEDQGSVAAQFLGITLKAGIKTPVYMYPDQATFQVHGAGLAVLFLQRAWYLSDHSGDTVLVTSPHSAGPFVASRHLLQAGCDEYVRSLMARLSGQLPPWLMEGLVLELGEGTPNDENLSEGLPLPAELEDPSLADFELGSGPRFADSFVAWIELRYGRSTFLDLLRSGGAYKKTLGADAPELFAAWMNWLLAGKPDDPRLSRRLNALPNAP